MPPRIAKKCVANRGKAGLLIGGPVLSASITVPDVVTKTRGGKHQEIKVNALIDTGASFTCVTARVINDLGLRPIGDAIFGGAYGQPKKRYLYCISFTFEGSGFQIPDVLVSEGDLHGSPFDMLVGRDVLQLCLFSYDGHLGKFTLDVPSPSSPEHPEWAAKQKQQIQQNQIEKKKTTNRKRTKISRQSKAKNR